MKEKILELRRAGCSINEISDTLGCAKSTISYHINKVGLGGVRHKFLNGITDEIISKVREYREQRKTYPEIKDLLNISLDKLKKICRVLDVNTSATVFKTKELDGDTILQYYLTVNSLRKTRKEFGVSRETIRRYIPDEVIEKNKCNRVKVSNSKSVVNWRKRSKQKLVDYKGGCCEKCGYNKTVAALQFHHLDPNEKDFTIGGSSYSFERLKIEVDKCIMVCATCHIEIHEELRNN